jgi:hypothetical protein
MGNKESANNIDDLDVEQLLKQSRYKKMLQEQKHNFE